MVIVFSTFKILKYEDIMKCVNGKSFALFVLLAFFVSISIEAGNRKGSQRVGGSNSKGKGSHYVGGKKGK